MYVDACLLRAVLLLSTDGTGEVVKHLQPLSPMLSLAPVLTLLWHDRPDGI